jgi:hypothetical protein
MPILTCFSIITSVLTIFLYNLLEDPNTVFVWLVQYGTAELQEGHTHKTDIWGYGTFTALKLN